MRSGSVLFLEKSKANFCCLLCPSFQPSAHLFCLYICVLPVQLLARVDGIGKKLTWKDMEDRVKQESGETIRSPVASQKIGHGVLHSVVGLEGTSEITQLQPVMHQRLCGVVRHNLNVHREPTSRAHPQGGLGNQDGNALFPGPLRTVPGREPCTVGSSHQPHLTCSSSHQLGSFFPMETIKNFRYFLS